MRDIPNGSVNGPKTEPKMRAVRYHGPGDIRMEEIDEPPCKRGQVKMNVHEYAAGPVLIPKEPHPITKETTPLTIGHEFAGIVDEVGEGVSRVQPGQKAAVRPTIPDGRCCSCQLGYDYCCDDIGFIGISGSGGGMANHIVAPESHFYVLPDHLSLEDAALIEPLAVAWHAISLSPFKPGNSAMVVGGGPIGICLVHILKLRGAKDIIVAEFLDNRKQLAMDYGATHTIDPREVDVPTEVREVTHSTGADVIFDTSGAEKALNSAIHACRTHGTIVNIAVWERTPSIQVNQLMYHEINLLGAALYDEKSFRDVVETMSSGQIKPDKMITDRIRLDQVVERGFEALLNDRGDHCKILVDAQT